MRLILLIGIVFGLVGCVTDSYVDTIYVRSVGLDGVNYRAIAFKHANVENESLIERSTADKIKLACDLEAERNGYIVEDFSGEVFELLCSIV